MSALLLADAVASFLEWATVNNAPRTVRVYRHYLNRFVAFAGNVPVESLSPALVTRWARKFHPVQAVQRLCSWLVREAKMVTVNPLAGMPKPKQGARRRTLSPRESACFLRFADKVFRRVLVALRESIARPQEVRALSWEDLRGDEGEGFDAGELLAGRSWFDLPDAKGYARRTDPEAQRIIPISPRLGRLLVRLRGRLANVEGVIFKNRFGKAWTANAIRCRVRRLRQVAGLGTDRRGERIVAYTLRHTGATAAAARGVRDFMLAEVMGHATTRTTQRYVHLTPDQCCKAMGRLWEAKTGSRPKKHRPESPRIDPNAPR